MLSTFAESLRDAIEVADGAAIVALLEPRVKAGSAAESEALLCGVLLLMPPLADYEAAASIFSSLLKGRRGFEAAVWDAYRFTVLLPDGDTSFEEMLRSVSGMPIAAHMLSMVAASRNDMPLALSENRRSRSLRPFPFNIVQALKLEPGLSASARCDLWQNACDLIISRSAESDAPVFSVEGALQRHWENLIVGTRLTGSLWDEYSQTLGAS